MKGKIAQALILIVFTIYILFVCTWDLKQKSVDEVNKQLDNEEVTDITSTDVNEVAKLMDHNNNSSEENTMESNIVTFEISDLSRDYKIRTSFEDTYTFKVKDTYNVLKTLSKDDEIIELASDIDNVENIDEIYERINEATSYIGIDDIKSDYIKLISLDGYYLEVKDNTVDRVEITDKSALSDKEKCVITYNKLRNNTSLVITVPVEHDITDRTCFINYKMTIGVDDEINPLEQSIYDVNNINKYDINMEETKNKWVSRRLDESKQQLEDDDFIEMPFSLIINDDELTVPFTGAILSNTGVIFNRKNTIVSNAVSYGDSCKTSDKGNAKTFEIGFINSSNKDVAAEYCRVASILTRNDSVKLKASKKSDGSNQENYEESSYILVGTSLYDTLKLLYSLGCKIYTNQAVNVEDKCKQYLTNGNGNYNNLYADRDEWKLQLRFYNTEDIKFGDGENYLASDFVNSESLKINYFDIIIVGNNEKGVTLIDYEYSFVDASEYSKRYRDMYE